MNRGFATKIFRATLALVYFQVNVAWGAATSPSAVVSVGDSFLHAARLAASLFQPVSKPARVFVFRDDEILNPPKPPEMPKVRPGEKADDPPRRDQENFEVKGKAIKDVADLKGPPGDFIKNDVLKPGADVKNLKLSDLNIDRLPVRADVRDLLVKARDAGDPQVKIWVDGGTPILTVAGVGSIKVFQDAKFPILMDASIDTKMAGTVNAFNAAKDKAPDAKDAKEAKPAAEAPEAKAPAKPAEPARIAANNAGALRGLGFNGKTTPKDVANIQGNGTWVVTTDAAGKQTKKFEGTTTWETSSGLKYTATATADGKVQLTREATGTFNGNNVAKNGMVTDLEMSNGKVVAKTTMPVGTTETRVNGELTHFDATNGPILREVLAPAGRAGKAGADAPPPAISGAKGEYVVREGALDSTFKMVGGKVELQGVKDVKTGAQVLTRQADGTMVGKLGGEDVKFTVVGGPRFDSATGAAQLNINIVAAAGEKRILNVPAGGGGRGGGDNGADGRKYDGVTFKALANGKMEVTANRDGATMAGTVGLAGGKVQLAQSSNISNATFVNKDGVEIGRTLDGVKILDKDGNPTARPPLVAMETTNAADLRSFAAIGVTHSAPFAIPAGATNITGTLQLPAEGGRIKANIDMVMPNGAAANLNIADGKHILTVDTTKVGGGAETTLNLGAADVEVEAGKNVKVDLDTIFSGAKTKQPDGVSVTEKIIVGRVDVRDVRQLGVNLDAKVVGGDVKAWINPLTGNIQMSHNGALQVEGKDFTGTLTMKNGRADTLTFQANGDEGATLQFKTPAGINSIQVPDTQTRTVDLNTGAFKPAAGQTLGDVMNGVTVKTAQGLDLTFSRDDKAPEGVAVKLNGDFKTFGADVKELDVKTARLSNGKVVLDLNVGLKIDAPITIAPGKPGGVVNNATITRLEVGMTGTVTGIGTTNVAEGARVFVPSGAAGAAGPGGAGAAGTPDLGGMKMKNVTIVPGVGGDVAVGKAGGGQLVIAVNDTGAKDLSGQVHLNAPVMENVTVDAGAQKINIGGFEFTGKTTVNRKDEKSPVFTAEGPGTVVNTRSGMKMEFNRAGQEVAFENGGLKNNAKLDGVKVSIDGVEMTFTKEKDKDSVVGLVGAINTTFMDEKIEMKDVQGFDKKPVTAKIEDGKIKIDFNYGKVVGVYKSAGGMTDITGKKMDTASFFVTTLIFDGLSGQKSAEGRAGLKDKESILAPPQPGANSEAKPEAKPDAPKSDAAKPPSKSGNPNAAGSSYIVEDVKDADGKVVATKITGKGWRSEVSGTLTEHKDADGKVVGGTFAANPFADFSKDISIGAGGVSALGKTWMPGTGSIKFDGTEFTRGNFKASFTEGAYVEDKSISEPGSPPFRLTATSDGALVFDGGRIVQKSLTSTTGTLVVSADRSRGTEASTGNFEGSGVLHQLDLKNNPDIGRRDPAAPPAETKVTIKDGVVEVTGGTRLVNKTDHDVEIKDADGKSTGAIVKPNTTFSYAGSLGAMLPTHTFNSVRQTQDAPWENGVTGRVLQKVGETRKLTDAQKPEGLRGGEVEADTYVVHGDGYRSVETQMFSVKGGNREAVLSPQTSEIYAKQDVKSADGKQTGTDFVHVIRDEKGQWNWGNANKDGLKAAPGTLNFKRMDYTVVAGKLNVSESSLANENGRTATVLLNSGEQVTGMISGMLEKKDDKWVPIPHQFMVHTGGQVEGDTRKDIVFAAADGKARLDRDGVVINAVGDKNSNVVATEYKLTDNGGKTHQIYYDNATGTPHFRDSGPADINFAGSVIHLAANGNVTTTLTGPEGSAAVAFTTPRQGTVRTGYEDKGLSQGIHIGTVHVLEEGQTYNGSSVAGTKVLAQSVKMEVDGKTVDKKIYLLTEDVDIGSAILGADGRLSGNQRTDAKGNPIGKEWLGTVGVYLKTDGRAGRAVDVGYRNGKDQGDQINVAGGGGGGGTSAPAEELVFHYAPDSGPNNMNEGREKMVMTRGEVFRTANGTFVKANTLLINTDLAPKWQEGGLFSSGKKIEHADYMRVLGSDGNTTRAIRSYASGEKAIAADVRERAQNLKLDSGTVGSGNGTAFVVLDGKNETVGSWKTSAKRETNWTGVIGTGKEYFDRGVFDGTKQVGEDVVTKNDDGTVTTTKVFNSYRDGKDGEMVREERTEMKMTGLKDINLNLPKEGKVVLKQGELLHVIRAGDDGENRFETTLSGNIGGSKRQFDCQQGYNYFMGGKGSGNMNEEKLKQAKENQKAYSDSIVGLMTGKGGGSMGDNPYQFMVVGKQRSVFANYSRNDASGGTGMRDFFLTVQLAPVAWFDVVAGTNHTEKMYSGEERMFGVLGLVGDGKFRGTALKDMDEYGKDLDKLMGGASFEDVAKGLETRNSWSGNFFGKLDKGAGWLLGADRIMALDTSKTVFDERGRSQGFWECTKETFKFGFHFGTCVAEQTLNFFSFGGGALLSTGGKGAVAVTKVALAAERTVAVVNAAEKVTVAARVGEAAYVAVSTTYSAVKAAVNFILFNPVSATTFTLFMRAKAADSVHKAINTNFEDPGSRKALGDTLTAAKDVALSEFAWIVPALGALGESSKVASVARAITGFGATSYATARQVLFVAAVGAGVGYANARPGEGLQGAGAGALAAVAGYTVYRVLGGTLPTFAARTAQEGKVASEAASGASFFQNAGAAGRAFVTGAVTNVVFQGGKGNFENLGSAVMQGGFVGLLGYGALKAVSNWNNVATAARDGKPITELLLAGNQMKVARGAIEAGAGIATFELVFNSVQSSGEIGGFHGLINPLTWASALTKGLNSTGIMGTHKEKAQEPFEGFFSLGNLNRAFQAGKGVATDIHFLAMFGRVGTGLASGNLAGAVGQVAGNLSTKATANYGRALVAEGFLKQAGFAALGATQQVASVALNKFVVMPATMFQFEAYQKVGVNVAQSIGLLTRAKEDSTGTLYLTDEHGEFKRDDKGQLIKASDNDVAGHKVVGAVAFIMAPVGPAHSESSKEVNQVLERAGPQLGDFFRVDGGASRRAPLLELAANIRNAAPEASAAGGGLVVDLGKGHQVTLGSNSVGEVSANATRVIASDSAFRSAVAEHTVGTVEAVVHDGATARVILKTGEAPATVAVTVADGKATATEATGKGATATGSRTETAGTVEFRTSVNSTEKGPGGADTPVTTEAKVTVAAEGAGQVLRVDLTGTSKAAVDPASEVLVTLTSRGSDGSEHATTVRATAAEAKAGIALEAKDGAAPDAIHLEVRTITESSAAKLLTRGEAGEAPPSSGLVKAAQEKLGVTGRAFVIGVDADLHNAGTAAYASGLGDDDLRKNITLAADGKMPTLVGALSAGRLAERRMDVVPGLSIFTGKGLGEMLNSGSRARTEFLGASEAGVRGEALAGVGLGTGVKTINGERVLVAKDGTPLKATEALSPEAIAQLPDAVKLLAGQSESAHLALGTDGLRINFTGVSQPARLFADGVPKNNGRTGAPDATGPPAGAVPARTGTAPAENPYARVEKTGVFESGQPVNISVLVGSKGAERYDVSQSGVKNGPIVSIVDGGTRYKNLNGENTAKVMNAENGGPNAAVENAMVAGQVNGGRGRTAEVTVVQGAGVAEARVQSFSLSAARPSIRATGVEVAERPVTPQLRNAVDLVSLAQPGAAEALLAAGKTATAADTSNGRENFVEDVVTAFRKSDLTPQEKGAGVRTLVVEAKKAERSASEALEVAEKKVQASSGSGRAAAETARDQIAAKRAEAADQTKLAELLVREVDRRGCSACFISYPKPDMIADAAEGALRALAGDTGFNGSERVADKFVADRLEISASEAGDTSSIPSRLLDAAEILKSRGKLREARILEAVAKTLENGTGGASGGASYGARGERIGKSEAEWRSANKAYNDRVVKLLTEGTSPDRLGSDRELKALATKLIDIAGVKATIRETRAELNETQTALKSSTAENKGPLLQAVQNLKKTLAGLEADAKSGDVNVIEKASKLVPLSESIQVQAGAKQLDAARVAEMRREIQLMPETTTGERAAKAAMTKVFEATESHVKKYNSMTVAERRESLISIDKAFGELRAAFPRTAELTRLEPLFKKEGEVTVADRNAVIADLFGAGKNESNLNPAERLAFVLSVSQGFFAVDGKENVKDALSKAEAKASTAVKTEKDSFDNGKRAGLLVQFMLGRTAGLEAGGGKTAIFPQAIAEFAMRQKAKGDSTPFVAELVVFNNGEVHQYVNRYQTLFRALGLEAVDGRISAGDTKAAIEAYTAKEGVTKVVVTDMNTRGFRQNDLEKAPNSELAQVMGKNVRLKAADEVDAQVLSRMAFINSDGNLVARDSAVKYTGSILDSVYGALGVKNGAEALGTDGNSPGYKDFAGTEVKSLKEGGVWYSKVGESVFISDAMMKKVQANLEAKGIKDVTTGEIVEVVRALASVRNPTVFGFTREGKEGTSEQSFRPTHKKDGMFQLGQIDSSPVFNVAAVLLERSRREVNEGAKPETLDKELSLGDIRLSKASASATLIQALQGGGNIHRFAATGTPEALEGIIQATLGLELTQVYSSSRHDFTVLGNKTVSEAFANRGAEKTGMTIDYVLTGGKATKASLGAEAVMEAYKKGDAILVGARDEKDLKDTLLTQIKLAGGTTELVDHLNSVKGGIRDVVREAKKILLTNENVEFAALRGNKTLVDNVSRLDVCDGNGGKEGAKWPGGEAELASGAVAEATSAGKKIVYSTEEGLRGRNFASKEGQTTVHAVFMGLELMSSEGRLQAWKRVDRDRNAAVRIEIVDTSVLKNRVETAKNLNEALTTKFGRPEGLFAADPELAKALGKDVKDMSTKELVDIAGSLSSLENLGQSSMFFINEQVEGKLLKEPLAAWKSRETSEAGKQFFADLQVDVLEHSDKKNIDQGTEYADPRKQALNAFNSGAERAIGYLTRVANNKNVSYEIRVEAAGRIADLVSAQEGMAQRLADVNPQTGKHDATEYQEAAFVNVSADVRTRPAQQVANAVVRLADLLLPNTRTSVEAAGAKGGTPTVNVTATAAAAVAKNRSESAENLKTNGAPLAENDAAFLAGVPSAKTETAGAKAAKPAGEAANVPITVSYRQQALVVAYQTFDGMSDDDKARALPGLVAAGLVSKDSASRDVPPGTSAENKEKILAGRDRAMAVELVNNLGAAGVPADRVDVGRVMQAASDLIALAPKGNSVTPSQVAFVALSPDQREATAQVLDQMKPAPPSPLATAPAADDTPRTVGANVATAFETERQQGADKVNRPSGSVVSMARYVFTNVSNAVGNVFNSLFVPSKSLTKMGQATLLSAANLPADAATRIDPSALTARLGGMTTLLTGLTGEARDKAMTVIRTLSEMTAADPAGMAPTLARMKFSDIVSMSRQADPVAALSSYLEKKDVPVLYRPTSEILPGWARTTSRGVGMVGSMALTFASSFLSPTQAILVTAATLLTSAVGADETKKDPLSEMMVGAIKKLPVVGGFLGRMVDKVPPAALPLVPAALMGVAALAGAISIWPAIGATAVAIGGLIGKVDLSKTPLVGSLWGKLTGVPSALETPAGKAAGVLRDVKADVEKETQAVLGKDNVLTELKGKLAAAPAGEKAGIQKQISAREAEVLKDNPVEGVTLGRVIAKIKETVPEAQQADALKKALLLFAGAEDGKAKRADQIVEKFKDTGSHADEGGLQDLQNVDLEDLLDPSTDLGVLAAVGRFQNGRSGGSVTVDAIDKAFGGDKVQVENEDGTGTRAVTPEEVVRFFGGEDMTDEEIGAARGVEKSEADLKTDLGVATPAAAVTNKNTPAKNDVASIVEAIRNNGVQARAADIVEAARPGEAVAQAAKDVAGQKTSALNMVGTILRMAGVSADKIRDFTASVLQSPAVTTALDAKLQGLAPKGDKQDVPGMGNVEPYALVSALLANTYFDASGIGLSSVQRNGSVLKAADVKVLSAVANPEPNEAGNELAANWSTVAPMFQAASVLGNTGAVKVSVTGTDATVYQVGGMGNLSALGTVSLTPTGATLKISYPMTVAGSPTPVTVAGTVEVRPLAGDAAGLAVVARPVSVARVETRTSEDAAWQPLTGTAIPAGNQFRFVPVLPAGQVVDENKLLVMSAPTTAPAAATPTATTPTKKDETGSPSSTLPRPTNPLPDAADVTPLGVGALRASLLPSSPGATTADPQDVLFRAGELLAGSPLPVAPAGTKPNFAVVRDEGGAVAAVFALNPADGKWHGIADNAGGLATRVIEDVLPADAQSLHVSGDAVQTIAAAKPAEAPRRSMFGWLANLFSARVVAPVALFMALTFGGNAARANTPDVQPLHGSAPIVAVQNSAPAPVRADEATVVANKKTDVAQNALSEVVGEVHPLQPVALSVPAENGETRTVVFDQPGAVLKAAAAVLSAPDGEKLTALAVTNDGKGTIHISGTARDVSAVGFEGAPVGGSPALEALSAELTAVPAKNPLTSGTDRPAIANFMRLLAPESPYAAWMNSMLVGPVLEKAAASPGGAELERRFGTEIQALRTAGGSRGLASVTWATAARIHGENSDFMSFLAQLSANTAEAVSVPNAFYYPAATHLRIAAETGTAPILMHGHGTQLGASFADRREAGRIEETESAEGIHGSDGTMLVASRRPNGTVTVTTFSADMLGKQALTPEGPQTVSPEQEQYQSLQMVQGALQGDLPALFRLLPRSIQDFLIDHGILRGQGLRAFDMQNPGDRAAANFILDMQQQLVEARPSAGTIRAIYLLAYKKANSLLEPGELNTFLKENVDSGIPLEALISGLSGQLRAPGLQAIAAAGQLMVLQRQVEGLVMMHRFGSVSAMPAQDHGWYINEMGKIRINVVSAATAETRARDIREQLAKNDKLLPDMIRQLVALTGAGTEGFLERLRAEMPRSDGFAIGSDVEAIIRGTAPQSSPEKQRMLQAKALSLLLEPMAAALIKTMGLSMEKEQMRKILKDVKITVVDANADNEVLAGGLAVFDESTNTFVISIPPDMKQDEALCRMVALLAHEITHLFTDAVGHELDPSASEKPTLAEEAEVQTLAGQLLVALRLPAAKLVGELLTYERISKMADAESVFLVYDDQVKSRADELKRIVRESKGLHSIVVIVTSETEARAAAKIFLRSGVRLVRLSALADLIPMSKQSRIETYAYLNLGTLRVRVALPTSLLQLVSAAGKDTAGVVALLRLVITPMGASGPALELLMPVQTFSNMFEKEILARVVAKQA